MGHFEGASTAARDRTASRIESDVERVKTMTEHVSRTTERIVQHARALGYFEPTPDSKLNAAPTAIVTTLADALQALDRAIDHCSGSLNVFD